MTPIAARSAAERYVADLLLECQASIDTEKEVAALFEVGFSHSAPPSGLDAALAWRNHESKRLADASNQLVDASKQLVDASKRVVDASETRGEIARADASAKQELVSNQLDPDKLTAWFQGAHMPLGVHKSDSPFLTALMSTPATKPPMPASPGKWDHYSPVASDHGGVNSPNPRSEVAVRPASAGASSQCSPSGASAFFWGGSGGVAEQGASELTQRCFDGDKPTLTGEYRESETHRLRRLLDPRYRRWPVQPLNDSSVDRRDCGDGSPLRPVPPKNPPQKPRRRSNPYAIAASEDVPCKQAPSSRGSARPSTAPPGKRQASQAVVPPSAQSCPKRSTRTHRHSSHDPSEQHAGPLTHQHTMPLALSRQSASGKSASAASSRSGVSCSFTRWRQKQQVFEAQRQDALKQKLSKKEAQAPELPHLRVEDDLRSMFRRKTRPVFDVGDVTVSVHELKTLADQLKMSMEDVFLVKEVFESYDSDRTGTLDIKEFDDAVSKLLWLQLGEEATSERIESLTGWHWWDSDVDKTGTIDFREFLGWYAGNGFSEEFMLSEDQRELRKIAKTYGVSVDYVDRMKVLFDECDTDQSGEVEFGEFDHILHKCMKVPPNCWVPPSRVQYFWMQIDTDGSGKITFNEFFRWWLLYFDDRSEQKQSRAEKKNTAAPFEAFYKQVRRMGANFVDPPPYPSGKAEIDDQDRVAQEIFGHLADDNFSQ